MSAHELRGAVQVDALLLGWARQASSCVMRSLRVLAARVETAERKLRRAMVVELGFMVGFAVRWMDLGR